MKNTGLIIGIVVFLLIAAGVTIYFVTKNKSDDTKTKQDLVKKIMAKYAGSPNFDASPDALMTKDIPTLQAILAGTIH